MTNPRPPWKWAGGKTQLLPQLLKRVPASYGAYREPFVGGGALFFALRPKRAVLSDVNLELVTAYQAIRDDVEAVIELLADHAEKHCRIWFEHIRKLSWATMPNDEVAARMIYLNKTAFNGLYRVNARGEFNAPFGRYAKPTICDRANLRACSEALKYAEILHWDFRVALGKASSGDFVYLDPPYLPSSATASFTGYSPGGFTMRDQAKLAEHVLLAANRGVHVLASNSDHRFIRELYQGLTITKTKETRAINCKAGKRGHVGSLLMFNEKSPGWLSVGDQLPEERESP